jgi:hypothetical protein
MKCEFTILNLKVDGKSSTEKSFFSTFEEVPGSVIDGESHACTVLRLERALLEHYQARGGTMNSESYCAVLADEWMPATRTKRKGQLSQTIILQQNNARLCTANKMTSEI